MNNDSSEDASVISGAAMLANSVSSVAPVPRNFQRPSAKPTRCRG